VISNSKPLDNHSTYCPYHDQWIRTFGALVVALPVVMMGNEDILVLFTYAPFYFDVLMAWASAWVLWTVLRRMTLWLDRQYDWFKQTFKRAVVQLVLGVACISFGVFIFTYLQYQWLYDQTFKETGWLVFELPLAVTLVFLINAYYLIYFLVWKQKYTMTETPGNGSKEEYDSEIIGLRGNESIRVPVEQVSKIFKTDQLNFMITEEGYRYMIVPSLDKVYSSLDPGQFFRANRQTIIARKRIHAFQSIENGKIQVKLTGEEDAPVIISQKRATAFRAWVK